MKVIISLLLSSFIAISILLGSSTINMNTEDKKASKGVETVKKLQNSDVSSVQKIINDNEKKLEEINNNYGEQTQKTNLTDFKNVFKRDIFIGDSQSEGLNLYGFLNDSSVCAQKGRTLYGAMDTIQIVKNANPENIYILFGMNDLIAFNKLQDLRDKYEEFILALKKEIPDANIYVNSMLEARNDAILKQPLLSIDRNAEGNELLKEMCRKNHVKFVDIRYILKDNPNLYEQDGLHCKSEFYKIWLTKLESIKEENNV